MVASGSWPFQVNLLQADKQPVASTIPQEGATGWADTTMMHADAEHPNCAYMWMEHSLVPEPAGRPGGLVRLRTRRFRRPARARAADRRGLHHQRLGRFRQDPVLDHARRRTAQGEGTCVPYYRWVSDYIGVIGGR